MTLELIQSTYIPYGFTLRRTSKNVPITKELYLKHLKYLSNFGQLCSFSDIVFEETSGLHCHGVAKVLKIVNLNRFRVRGWNIKLEELYYPDGWALYLAKDQPLDSDEFIDDDSLVWQNKNLFH